MAPTVAILRAEVASRIGRLLLDAGLYVPAGDGSVAAIDAGIRVGLAAVGVALASPMSVVDADVANLSSFMAERVADEAECHGLGLVVLNWYRVVQAHMEARESAPLVGGWLAEEKSSVKARHAELKARLATPYREPCEPMVVANAPAWGYPGDPCGPGAYAYAYPCGPACGSGPLYPLGWGLGLGWGCP